ncbi:MAG: 4-hydroxythreonine-4-phosphate dehydrogenase PdxA [Phycisphaerales bacterium]|nr:4-hydroxythreonine-4-phosphate dehydrogenase PdxA [Phycisphaerales bacterium]
MSHDNQRPVVGLSMGDPAGIGPEIIVKALANSDVRRSARFVIHGANDLLTLAADRLEIEPFWQRVPADNPDLIAGAGGDVIVRDHDHGGLLMRLPAEPTRRGGHASKLWVDATIADAMRTPDDPAAIDAMVTAPINKQAWRMADHTWPGHTELLAHRTRSRRTAMCFESPKLRVILATIHVPLMELRNLLTIGRVFDPIDLGHHACRELGIPSPRIAVAGLNPHAGEQGLMGDEEQRVIEPAVRMARDAGIDANGPFPADVVFRQALEGRWDLVVAMYHDQGLIPMKLVQHRTAVNWTVGLPIIRTSPDHGTAYDIAGTGQADAGSMEAAIRLAVHLAVNRRTRATSS